MEEKAKSTEVCDHFGKDSAGRNSDNRKEQKVRGGGGNDDKLRM